MIAHTCSYLLSSYEFKLKFPKLSQAKLGRFQAKSSRAGAFQFLSWNQTDSMYVHKKQIFSTSFKFPNFVLVSWLKPILINLMVTYLILEVFLKLNVMIFHHNSIIVKTCLVGWLSSLNREIFVLNWKGQKPSRVELTILQLKPWFESARLELITTIYHFMTWCESHIFLASVCKTVHCNAMSYW